MGPVGGDSAHGEAVARYCELLSAWDRAVYLGELRAASARHADLSEFLDGLRPPARAALEGGRVVLPGWSAPRLRRLGDRWDALKLHGGSWVGWCQRLRASGAADGGSQPSREALRGAARDLVYRQAPDRDQRPELWGFCAGALEEGEEGAADVGSREAQEAYEEIMLDVRRTPNLSEGQEAALANILRTHCVRMSAKGGTPRMYYVQGMHMLAACPLWAGLSEAKAAAVFEFVLQTLCMGYYVEVAFDTFQRDVCVADALISEHLPQLSEALQAAGVSVMMLAFDPLLCLFTQNMPLKCVLRLWDVLLLEGDTAVFAVLLATLERLVPEASGPLTPPLGPFWDGSPFQEKLQESSAHVDAEELLGRAKAHLEWPGASLRQRVQQLRQKSAAHASEARPAAGKGAGEGPGGPWWDQVLTQVRSWWDGAQNPALARGYVVRSSSPLSRAREPPSEVGAPIAVELADKRGTVNSEWAGDPDLSAEREALAMPPVEFTMILSEHYRPGEAVFIRGPHGSRLEVRPPPDALPGASVRYRLGPQPDFELRVPPGSGPGREVVFLRRDGVRVSATVPDGLQPGDVWGVLPPAAMVLVPDGAKPGDSILFRAVGGPPGWCRARVPPGAGPGKYFAARLPPPAEPPQGGGWLQDFLGFAA